jgi:hypothetical protein
MILITRRYCGVDLEQDFGAGDTLPTRVREIAPRLNPRKQQ